MKKRIPFVAIFCLLSSGLLAQNLINEKVETVSFKNVQQLNSQAFIKNDLNEDIDMKQLDPLVPSEKQLANAKKQGQLLMKNILEKPYHMFSFNAFAKAYLTLDNNESVLLIKEDGSLLEMASKGNYPNTFLINGNALDNILTIDKSIIDAGIDVLYIGGAQETAVGDVLIVGDSEDSPFKKVEIKHINANDGTITIDEKSVITYVGLEPITIAGTTADMVIDLPDATPNTDVFLQNDATAGSNILTGSTFEDTTFTNPTNSLTINGGDLEDLIRLQGVDTAFDADFTVEATTENDRVNINTNPLNLGSGNLLVTTRVMEVGIAIETTGDITTTTYDNTYVNTGSLLTTDGAITVTGGAMPTPGRNFRGIDIRSGTIAASGTGSIDITGTSQSVSGNGRNGVFVRQSSSISTQSGAITINGSCSGSGNAQNIGIRINNPAFITTVDGAISLTGTGSAGSGNLNVGIAVLFGARVEATGSGDVSLTGVGGTSTSNANYGVILQQGKVYAAGGNITIDGTGGEGADNQIGTLFLQNSDVTNTGMGNVVINGSGGTGTSSAAGIVFNNNPSSSVVSEDGNITLTGIGSTTSTGSNIDGIIIGREALIESTGSGSITINGTAGANTNLSDSDGIFIRETSILRTNGGGITAIGTGGDGSGNDNRGVVVTGNSTLEDTAGGVITIEGYGVSGQNRIRGVEVEGNATIQATGGEISITGEGGNASSFFAEGIVIEPATIQDLNGGTITFNGTGGITGGNTAPGIWLNNASTLVTTTTGDITLNGIGTDTTGLNNQGVALSNDARVVSMSGNIVLDGTTAATGFDAIDFDNLNSATVLQLETGGDITLQANLGTLHTPDGVMTTDIWQGNTISINGILTPGNTIGQTLLTGAFVADAGDEMVFDVAGFVTAGIDFDQVVVTGTIDISDAVLNIEDSLAAPEDECGSIILIENDDTDGVIGTFNGLPEGAAITTTNINAKISYVGGDGNDVVLILDATPITVIAGPVDIFTGTGVNDTQCETVVDYGPVTIDSFVLEDNCGDATTTTVTQTGGLGSGAAFPVGITIEEYTLTDNNGNEFVYTFEITVADTTAPVMDCPEEMEVTIIEGETFIIEDYTAFATDNCSSGDDLAIVQEPAVGTEITNDTTVTLTATDAAGNTSTCEFLITVEETLSLDNVSFRESAITLYPVPTGAVLNVDSPVQIDRAEVYDIRGRLVAKKIMNTAQGNLDMSSAKAGVYLVYLIKDSQTIVKRLTKE